MRSPTPSPARPGRTRRTTTGPTSPRPSRTTGSRPATLTVNLGLRWEMQAGPYQNNFDTPVLRELKALGYPTERKQDMKDFGPRVGFAYDVIGNGKTVVRGGFGIYYDEIFQNITLYEKWNDVRTPLFFVSAVPGAVHGGTVRGKPGGDPELVHRSDVCRPDHAPDGTRPEAAVLAAVQRRLLPPTEPAPLVRRGLHPRGRETRDRQVDDRHGGQPKHAGSHPPASSSRCGAASTSKETAVTRRSTGCSSRASSA